jgi:hypothetical protein
MSDDRQWVTDESIALGNSLLSKIRAVIENESAVIVEHRFYKGARSPHRFVCDDFEELQQYLKASTSAGDAIHCWHFETCCTDQNSMITAKIPDSLGKVPRGGAY